MAEEYFQPVDILSFIAWLFLFCMVAHIVRARHRNDPEYAFYLPHFYMKLAASVGFGIIYITVLSGDTTSYWKGAAAINKLILESPSDYLYELFSSDAHTSLPEYFKDKEGYFFLSHYVEYNTWFVSRIMSIPCLLSFNSYFTLCLWMGMLSSWVSWRFYRFCLARVPLSPRLLALALLFMPSVAFWCSSVTKDTVVFMGMLITAAAAMKLFEGFRKPSAWLFLIIGAVIIMNTRSFILLAMITAALVTLVLQANRNKSRVLRIGTVVTGFLIAFSVLAVYFSNEEMMGELSSTALLENAETIQMDFAVNQTYTGGRYDLGQIDFTPAGMVRVAPTAIFAGLFRPIMTDDVSAVFLLNVLEGSTLLALFLLALFRRKIGFRLLTRNRMITFAIVLVLILSFFFGFCSGLFGVLVRMRAPLLPFLLLIILFALYDRRKTAEAS
jgi:hypothetical protein